MARCPFPGNLDVEGAPFRVLRTEELQFLVFLRLSGAALKQHIRILEYAQFAELVLQFQRCITLK